MICQRGGAAVGVFLTLAAMSGLAQTTPSRAPRTANGRPDLNGIWEALSTANWDLQDHAPEAGPLWQTGAIGAAPAGLGVVVGNDIPYLPEAAAKKKENFANRAKLDPEAKCYLPGVPRATYMPFPFQIVESPKDILFVYEFASANRLVNMGKPKEAGADSWMGTSNGHWEGNTLVVETTNFNDKMGIGPNGGGIPQSEEMKLTERFTRVSDNTINYELTVNDPKTYTAPWKIGFPITHEPGYQIFEYACHEGNMAMRNMITGTIAEKAAAGAAEKAAAAAKKN